MEDEDEGWQPQAAARQEQVQGAEEGNTPARPPVPGGGGAHSTLAQRERKLLEDARRHRKLQAAVRLAAEKADRFTQGPLL